MVFYRSCRQVLFKKQNKTNKKRKNRKKCYLLVIHRRHKKGIEETKVRKENSLLYFVCFLQVTLYS